LLQRNPPVLNWKCRLTQVDIVVVDAVVVHIYIVSQFISVRNSTRVPHISYCYLLLSVLVQFAFSALPLLVGQQDSRRASKNLSFSHYQITQISWPFHSHTKVFVCDNHSHFCDNSSLLQLLYPFTFSVLLDSHLVWSPCTTRLHCHRMCHCSRHFCI